MKLAVVVHLRNAESLLPDSVAAILRQTLPRDEVLLIIGPTYDGNAQSVRDSED